MSDWRGDVLKFWFGLKPEQWWRTDPLLDAEVRRRFLELWEQKRQLPTEHFLDHPLTALAGVILFDQLPRNMFRGHADQYSTDHLARAIARGAVDRGLDEQLQPQERGLLYMPFQHSEDRGDQMRSLQLFTKLGNPQFLKYAKLHHDIIARFRRFPHRNAILGRAPRADEVNAGKVVPW
ncbi:MAG TPA: DUF924 family protein [Sphingomicrobium sp.]|nr:DUF924 family protein [Sphingomicrobium sp.]